MAIVFQNLIKNQSMSPLIYYILMGLDMLLQLVIFFEIFATYLSRNVSLEAGIDSLILQNSKNSKDDPNSSLIVECSIILGILAVIQVFFSVLIFKQHNQQKITNLKSLFQILACLLVLLRTFFSTYIILITTANIVQFEFNEEYISLFLSIAIMFMVLFISYMQSQMFNLTIPHEKVPWAETSHSPFLAEIIFKFILAFMYQFRENIVIMHILIGSAIVIQSQKIYHRSLKSFIFNEFLRNITYGFDVLVLYLLIMLIPGIQISQASFTIYIILLMPFIVIIAFYNKHLIIRRYITNNKSKSVNLKLCHMLFASSGDQAISKNQMLKIFVGKEYFLHYFNCDAHYDSLTCEMKRKLKNKIKNPKTDNYLQNNNPSQSFCTITQTIENTQNQNEEIKNDSDVGVTPETSLNMNRFKYITIMDKFGMYQQSNDTNKSSQKNFNNIKAYSKAKSRSQLSFQLPFDENQGQQQDYKQDNFDNKTDIDYTEKYLKHLMKHHLQQDPNITMQTMIILTYWIIQMQNKLYQGQIYLFLLNEQAAKTSFLSFNKVIMHSLLYQQDLEIKNHDAQSNIQFIDIQKMISANQLISTFEKLLIKISEEVSTFWEEIVSQKLQINIYKQSLRVSELIENLRQIYNQITALQQDRTETKVYFFMAQFYKFVLFKSDEQAVELQKLRTAYINSKFQGRIQSQGTFDNMGIIMARLDFINPMRINYANLTFANMIEMPQQDCNGLFIDSIMPDYVQINHQQFMRQFISTGKNYMINQSQEIFIKNSKGYLIPVKLMLKLNHQDIKHAIVAIEPQQTLSLFEISNEESHDPAIFILDNNYQVTEMNEKMISLIQFSNALLEEFRDKNGLSPSIDDLFYMEDIKIDILQLINKGQLDFEVKVKFDVLLELIQIDEQRDFSKLDLQSQEIEIEELRYKTFVLKIYEHHFKQKHIKPMKIMTLEFHHLHLSKPLSITQNLQQNSFLNAKSQDLNLSNPLSITKAGKLVSNQPSINFEGFDLSSQTSTNSTSTSNSLFSKINDPSQSSTNQKIPSTLKFILQLIILLGLIIIGTSTVSVVLTIQNFNSTKDGIVFSQLAMDRQVLLSKSRLLVRLIFMIGQGYSPAQNRLLPQRLEYYQDLVTKQMELLRQTQNKIDSIEADNAHQEILLNVYFLDSNNQVLTATRSLSESVMTYVNYGSEIVQLVNQQGVQVLQSKLAYFKLNNDDITTANQVERVGYFLLQNGNQNLYRVVTDYTLNLINQKVTQIDEKQIYQQVMTWVCISVIITTCLLILPLFGRIQDRIVQLIQIFFSIEKNLIATNLQSIEQFQEFLEKYERDQDIQQRKILQVNQQSNSSTISLMKVEKQKSKNKLDSYQDLKIEIKDATVKKKKKIKVLEQKQSEEDIEDESKDEQLQQQKDITQKVDIETQKQLDRNQQQIADFRKSTQRMKYIQFTVIFGIACFLSGYFIGTFFLSDSYLQNMKQSLQALQVINYRHMNAEHAIHAITEKFIWNKNKPLLVNYGKNDILEFFLGVTQQYENKFINEITNTRPAFLDEALGYLDTLERGQFCDQTYDSQNTSASDDNSVTSEDCKQFLNGIAVTGLTNVYQTIYKTVTQNKITFDNALQKQPLGVDPSIILSMYTQMSQLVDVLESILTKPYDIFIKLTQKSIINTIDQQMLVFFSIFWAFIIITIVGFIIFITNVFQRQKREMLLSNKVLYIIDFEAITEQQKNSISKFLNKY
eukprot:403338271